VSEPLAQEMLTRGKVNWEALREAARLCPECRRRRAARVLESVAAKGQEV
jgi:hypothetical protein